MFYSTECPSSGLFAGAATEAATCPQEFTGGVRTSSSNGIACYSGLTADSTAVFMCSGTNATCTASCVAVCACPRGQTEGQWSASFESVNCGLPAILTSTCNQCNPNMNQGMSFKTSNAITPCTLYSSEVICT